MTLVAVRLVAAQLRLFHVDEIGQSFTGSIAEGLLALGRINALESHFELLVWVCCILSWTARSECVAV